MLTTDGDVVTERTLNVLTNAARRSGLNPRHAEIAPTRLERDGTTMVPAEEYRALLRQVFSADDEALGITLAMHLPVEEAGLWGFLLRSSPTFGDLLYRAARYVRLFYRFTEMSLAPVAGGLALTCDHPRPSPFGNPDQEVCFFLGQWITWGRSLIGDTVVAERVEMRWRGPAVRNTMDAFFGCSVTFGAERDCIVFRDKVAQLRLPEATPELGAMFESYAASVISDIESGTDIIKDVRAALSEALLRGSASEDAVAAQLGLTNRTLRRRLADQGQSFRDLRKDFLRSRAKTLLQDDRLSISEAAFLLGYSEPSTFHRAFRRWTGLSPAAWRMAVRRRSH